MDKNVRSGIAGGTILILLGVAFLIFRMVPDLIGIISWPFIVIGVGAAFLVLAVVTWTPGLAVPGCIVAGIGGILYWQHFTGRWDTWAYMWTLIPGFVGVGIFISELLEGKPAKALVEGGWPILISIVLFFLFGSFLGNIPWSGTYFAVALIVIGVLIIVRPLIKIGGKKEGT
jgi:hypothetical protein